MAPVDLHALKSAVKQGAGALVTRLRLLDRLHRGQVLVLTYHRVLRAGGDEQAAEPGMYVTDASFRRHMAFVKAHYDVLAMRDWLDAWAGPGLPRGRYCLVTFDDGWRDTFDLAFPILRELGLPATVFLPTGFVGTSRWFWTEQATFLLMRGELSRLFASRPPAAAAAGSPWRALEPLERLNGDAAHPRHRAEAVSRVLQALKGHPPDRLDAFCEELGRTLQLRPPSERAVVTWDEVRRMSAAGIAFGSHTVSHAILPGMPADAVRAELSASRRALESQQVNTVPVFCYPNGAHDARVERLVQEAGYRAAVTTRYGLEGLTPGRPFAIRRVAIHEDVARSEALLALRLIAAPLPQAGGSR